MVKILDKPLVQPGFESVYTKENFVRNQSLTLEQAAKDTLEINQVNSLRERFLEVPSLFQKKLPSHSVVETHIPSGAYSAAAIQVTALSPEIVDNLPIALVDGRVPTRTIYDFPEDAKLEYFTQILSGVNSVNQEFHPYSNGEYRVLFTENAAAKVSDEKHRIARTVAEPHTQIWIASGNPKPLDSKNISRMLRHEREVTKLLTEHIEEELGHFSINNNIVGSIRNAPPYGYVLETNISKGDSLSRQSVELSKLMTNHHKKYTVESTQLVKSLESSHEYLSSLLLPQPSYKVFGTYNENGLLEISIAPTIFASAGVVEVLDKQIHRDHKNQPFFQSSDGESLYYYAISESLKKQR